MSNGRIAAARSARSWARMISHQRCQFVDLDTVQSHDEFFGFAKSKGVGSSTSFASLAYAFSDIEGT